VSAATGLDEVIARLPYEVGYRLTDQHIVASLIAQDGTIGTTLAASVPTTPPPRGRHRDGPVSRVVQGTCAGRPCCRSPLRPATASASMCPAGGAPAPAAGHRFSPLRVCEGT